MNRRQLLRFGVLAPLAPKVAVGEPLSPFYGIHRSVAPEPCTELRIRMDTAHRYQEALAEAWERMSREIAEDIMDLVRREPELLARGP